MQFSEKFGKYDGNLEPKSSVTGVPCLPGTGCLCIPVMLSLWLRADHEMSGFQVTQGWIPRQSSWGDGSVTFPEARNLGGLLSWLPYSVTVKVLNWLRTYNSKNVDKLFLATCKGKRSPNERKLSAPHSFRHTSTYLEASAPTRPVTDM